MTKKHNLIFFFSLLVLMCLSPIGNFNRNIPASSYTVHAPIAIASNSQFASQASAFGWLGNGLSAATPYVIDGYSITHDMAELIIIEDTTVYFIIQNCYLDSVKGGTYDREAIYLRNVQNGVISNNIIENNRHGIFINTGCEDITIEHNTIDDTSESGIRLNSTNSITISNNTISNCIHHAIWLTGATNTYIDENELFLCYNGIWMREGSEYSTAFNNTIYDVTNGIWISNSSDHCDALSNLITQSTYGIYIADDTRDTKILNNSIIDCTSHGIIIDSTSYLNSIANNSFVNNNAGGTAQGIDNGTLNAFDLNFWDEWTSPDVDVNGIVDNPYSLEGTSSNADSQPRTTPTSEIGVHLLTPASIIYPLFEDSVNETILVEWSPAFDSQSHTILYNVSFRHNISSWVSLGEELSATNVNWNTSESPDGSGYQIRIISYCTNGLETETVSDQFIVYHTPIADVHFLTPATFISPLAYSVVNETILIQWNPAIDSLGHTVYYNVSYKYNASAWFPISTGIIVTNTFWNTSEQNDGSGYEIKIDAYCSHALVDTIYSGAISIDHTDSDTEPDPGPDGDFPVVWFYVIGGVAGATIVGLSIGIIVIKKRKSRAS